MTASPRTPKTTLHACECSNWEFGTWTGEVPEGADPGDYYTTEDTGCGRVTNRVFAQGHDAKLVGFMVRAELSGQEICKTEGGVRITFPGAVEAAQSISGALGTKAALQLAAATARANKKASRKSAKAATTGEKLDATRARQAKAEAELLAEPVIAPAQELVPVVTNLRRPAKIKVGRWTYDALIAGDGTATYTTKLGGTKTAPAGTYSEV